MSPPGRSGSGTAGDNNWREQPLRPTTGYIRDTQFNEMSDMPPQVGDPDPDSRPRPRTYVAQAPPPCAPDARPRDDGDEPPESRAGPASHPAFGERPGGFLVGRYAPGEPGEGARSPTISRTPPAEIRALCGPRRFLRLRNRV